jgi:hypothetical protein
MASQLHQKALTECDLARFIGKKRERAMKPLKNHNKPLKNHNPKFKKSFEDRKKRHWCQKVLSLKASSKALLRFRVAKASAAYDFLHIKPEKKAS